MCHHIIGNARASVMKKSIKKTYLVDIQKSFLSSTDRQLVEQEVLDIASAFAGDHFDAPRACGSRDPQGKRGFAPGVGDLADTEIGLDAKRSHAGAVDAAQAADGHKPRAVHIG